MSVTSSNYYKYGRPCNGSLTIKQEVLKIDNNPDNVQQASASAQNINKNGGNAFNHGQFFANYYCPYFAYCLFCPCFITAKYEINVNQSMLTETASDCPNPCFDPCNFCCLGYDVKDGRNQLIGRMTRNCLHCVPCCYKLDIQSQVERREFIVRRDCGICFLLPCLCGARWYGEDNSGSSVGEIRHKVCHLKTCCIPYYELNFTSSLSSTDKMLIMSSVMIVE